eukprot:Gb_01155 [translate_table: standard]
MSHHSGSLRTRVGKYEFGPVLGEGSFGKVLLAKHVETGQSLAIKVLSKERILKDKMTEQIKREISTMKLVKHPNIVQLLEVMASKSKIYFVLEYVTGGELFNKIGSDLNIWFFKDHFPQHRRAVNVFPLNENSQFIKTPPPIAPFDFIAYAQHGKLKEDDARKYFQQLINAVDYCHSRGVYHRDLKHRGGMSSDLHSITYQPENLLLDAKGNLKISDFGLSALSQQVREDGLLHTTCGTPNYVAPEVIVNNGYDGAKADLWSSGVILFVLMAGYLPFDEPNIMALYKKVGYDIAVNYFAQEENVVANLVERITIPEILENSWFKKCYTPVRFQEERDTSLGDIDAVFGDSIARETLCPWNPVFCQHKDFFKENGGITFVKLTRSGLILPTYLSLQDSEYLSHQAKALKYIQWPFNYGLIQCWNNTICPEHLVMEQKEPKGTRPSLMNAFDIISLSKGLNLSGLFEKKQGVKKEARFTSKYPATEIITKMEEIAKPLGFNVKRRDYKMKLQGSETGRKGHLSVATEVFEVSPSLFVVEVKKAEGDTLEYNKSIAGCLEVLELQDKLPLGEFPPESTLG